MKRYRLRLLVYFFGSFLVTTLLILYAVEYNRLSASNNNNDSSKKIINLIDQVDAFRASLNSVDITFNKYLLTRDRDRLEDINRAQVNAMAHLDSLKQVCSSSAVGCTSINRLDSLYQKSQFYMTSLLEQLTTGTKDLRKDIPNEKKYDSLRHNIIRECDSITKKSDNRLLMIHDLYDRESTDKYMLLGMVTFITLLILGFIIWRIFVELKAKESILKRYQFFEQSNEGLLVTNSDFVVTYANKAIDGLLKMNGFDIIGTRIFDYISDLDVPMNEELRSELVNNLAKSETTYFDFYHDAVAKWLRVTILPSFSNYTFFVKDVTAVKEAEQAAYKSRRLYEFIGSCNDLILRAKTPEAIYSEICKIAVEKGDFLFGWIGIPDESKHMIEARYQWNEEEDYVKELKVSTLDDAFGQGPTGRAYRTGKYYYCNDIVNDPVMATWASRALQRGFRSSIALPVKAGEKVVSLVTLYAPRAFFFTDDEIRLLLRVAENISFAITAFENNQKRIAAENELLKVTRAVEQSSASVVITNINGKIEYVNPAFTKLTGFEMEEVVGQNPNMLKTGHTSREEYGKMWYAITHFQTWEGEFLNKKKNGETYWEHAVISPILNEKKEITHFVAVKENITERKRIEQEQQQLLDIFENTNAFVATCDMSRRFIYANKAFRDILEIDGDDITQYIVDDFRPDDGFRVLEEMNVALQKTGKWIGENTYRSRSGKDIPVMQVVVLHKDQTGKNTQISTTAIDLSRVKETEKDLLRLNRELREFSRHLQSVREVEKNKILSEVHDELGQGLAALMIDVSWIKKHLRDEDPTLVSKKIDGLLDAISGNIDAFSRIYSSMNPSMLSELGLHASIEYLISSFTKSSGVQVRFSSNIENEAVHPNQSLALYRIIQEALANIKQHARASHVTVSLIRLDGTLDLSIEDDGIGFSPSAVDSGNHYGLLEIRERIYAMNGTFTLVAAPGQGTKLQIQIPLEKR
ncbi:MAG: PAS domain S-box protein [Bacteroidetes bacterium]|nr:PAS domain S-box protein [Bacteroidota bacterium]